MPFRGRGYGTSFEDVESFVMDNQCVKGWVRKYRFVARDESELRLSGSRRAR